MKPTWKRIGFWTALAVWNVISICIGWLAVRAQPLPWE